MKKFLVMMSMALGIIFTASCSNEDTLETPQIRPQEKAIAYNTLTELRELNDSLVKEQKSMRSGFWDRCKIAHADYKWGKKGFKAGQIIAGWAGVASGGAGYIAIVGVSTAASAGLASFIKAKENDGDAMSFIDYEESLEKMNNLYDLHSSEDSIGSLGTDSYNAYAAQIQLPSNFEYVRRLGNDHNAILTKLKTIEPANGIMSNEHGVIDNPINTTNPFVEEVFSNRQFNAATYSAFQHITASSDGDAYCSSGSDNVDEIYDMFLSIMETYFNSPSDLISAINSYINIIENNNELTTSEKEIVYGGFMIAFYSVQYWNEQ